MTSLSVSVVIVSRHRPNALRNCLSALRFQKLPAFEVVVVGDPSTSQVISDLGLTQSLKHGVYDQPNISQARNIGVSLASGDVIAFIDDDAVAEPTWLQALTAPFADPILSAAGGFVLGRNGIDLQWGAEMVGPDGESLPTEVTGLRIFDGTRQQAVKTHGANCAFRRSVLQAIGGFDEGYHFYLDETDLNIRLGQQGHKTAIVPDALVQHGYLASIRRRADRIPLSLFELGASQSHFLRKHGRDLDRLKDTRNAHRVQLVKTMVSGGLEPVDVGCLLRSFDDGVAEGLTRNAMLASIPDAATPFLRFNDQPPKPSQVLYAPRRQKAALFAQAAAVAKTGVGVTAMSFSRSSLFHHRGFHPDGFWVQTGGLYGKSLRSDPYFRRYTQKARAERERSLLASFRGCADPVGFLTF